MRPQLTVEEASGYSQQKVLAGPVLERPTNKAVIYVSPSAEGAYRTLQSAVDAAIELARSGPIDLRILLSPGDYAGPVVVPAVEGLYLSIEGAGADRCRLSASIFSRMSGRDYARLFASQFDTSPAEVRAVVEATTSAEEIGTRNSCVLHVTSPQTQLRGFCIKNSYNCDRTAEHPPEPGALCNAQGQWSDETHQAVALLLENADGSECESMLLSSFQDTLYLNQTASCPNARYRFNACTVEGDIDYVFGPATAYFSDSEFRTLCGRSQNSWVTAPSTPIDRPFGFVIDRCRFTHSQLGADKVGRFKLGRQWFTGVRLTPYGTRQALGFDSRLGDENLYHETGGTVTDNSLRAVGKCVVLNCEIGAHIDVEHPWDDWKGSEYRGDGSYWVRDWSPWFRPAQCRVADVVENLRSWSDAGSLSLPGDPRDILLGEFNNSRVG